MKIKHIFLLSVFCLLILLPQKSFASETSDNFTVDSATAYKVSESGDTTVIQKLTITNKKEYTYSPSYSISLHLKTVSDISVTNAQGSIPYRVTDEKEGNKKISVDFPDKIIGIGKQNEFTLSFVSHDFAVHVGNIWEFTIPNLSDPEDFNTYTATVSVPQSFGDPSIIKPETTESVNGKSYTFSKGQLSSGGITIYFGNTQVYNFNLSYHLENNNLFPVSTEIALPPETSYQDVLINDISPKPKSVYKDSDNNVLATYVLKPKSLQTVTVKALVKVGAFPHQEYLDDTLKPRLVSPQQFWEAQDPEIVSIAHKLKTPDQIYSYVVKTLSYNYDKTNKDNPRIGAKGVLSKPYYAVCLEFTDLFVALARAAGIPARAVEGYAYAYDDSTHPTSLFKDILHAWPEYYDSAKKTWVMVDPTWGNTTKGTDYFTTFDYDHVAFAINGFSSTYPVPAGGYKTSEDTKDIVVSYSDPSEFVQKEGVRVSSSFSSFSQGAFIEGKILQMNAGNHTSSPKDYSVYVDGVKVLGVTLPETPPLGTSTIMISPKIPKDKSFIASLTNIWHTVTIKDENNLTVSSSKVQVFPFSINILIGGAILFAAGFVFIIAFKTRSVSVPRQFR